MRNLNEKSIPVYFKHNSSIRKLVMLVLVSINHLIPVPAQEQELQEFNDESLPEEP